MTDAENGQDRRLRLLRASAGTGKTYALTTRYLALIRGGADPATVLATTFTRKAAGEVFGRVLTRLADAVLAEDACRRLDADLRLEGLLRGGAALTRGETSAMLGRLVGALDRVSISTIDSFFGRVCGAFSLELGIPLEPAMTDDGSALAGELRGLAIEGMLGEAAADDFASLLGLLRQLHHDSGKRSVTESLDGVFTGEAGGFYGVYRQAREAAKWPALKTPGGLEEGVLQWVISDLSEAEGLLPVTQAGKPNAHWAKALRSDVGKAHARDWAGLMSSGLSRCALSGGFYRKCEMPEALREMYVPLAEHAVSALLEAYNARSRSTHALLERFAKHFERGCREQGVLLFADLTDALARHLRGASGASEMAGGWGDELAYRLDGQVEHLLLDEFQDTSVDQFAVLWPLIEEVSGDASSGRTFFCVGDAKQSIYGWRGGRPELFGRLSGALEARGMAAGESLDRSYRSSPAVMSVVNRVFGCLAKATSWEKDAVALARFGEVFESHRAVHDGLGGEVVLRTTRLAGEGDEEGDAGEGGHWASVAAHVKGLRARHPLAEIGVLSRTNREVNLLLHALRTAGVSAAGEAGVALTDHPAVGAVLSALALADHPDDTVAAFHVAGSPLGAVIGLEGTGRAARWRASAGVRRALVDGGYAAVIAGWAGALGPACDAMGRRRLGQLAQLAEGYRATAWLRATAFVRFVEQSRVEDPAGAGGSVGRGGVRVMTVHRAKGLEFDWVVLPTLHGAMRFRPAVLEERADAAGGIDAVYRAGDAKLRALSEKLTALHESERQRFVYEQLCALYVGVTRAKCGLSLLIPPAPEKKKGRGGGRGRGGGGGGQTFASLLVETLCAGADLSMEEAELFSEAHGGGVALAADAAGDGEEKSVDETGAVGGGGGVGSLRSLAGAGAGAGGVGGVGGVVPSAARRGGGAVVGDLLSAGRGREGAAFGTRVHGFFERVGFVDGSEAAVAGALVGLREAGAGDVGGGGWVGHVERALGFAEIGEALSRRGAAGLWREHGFAMVDEAGRTVRGVMDRVVWWEDESGKPTRAEVLDFKTDALEAGDEDALAERAAHHREQVTAYRRAAAGLLGLEVGCVKGVLLFTGVGRVVESGR